ncbi:MAG: diacylglycerol/polyprenol kinase family protein [Myxococcota bacterium]
MALGPRELAVEMHGLLADIDAVQRPTEAKAFYPRFQRLQAAMVDLRDASDTRLRNHLAELREVARRYAPRDGSPTWEAMRRWQELAARLKPAFARWMHSLRAEGVTLPAEAEELADPAAEVQRARPGNLLRNVFHVGNAVAVIGLVAFVLPTPGSRIAAALGGLVLAWSMEAARRLLPGVNRRLMQLFARVAHPHETTEINSATWYATAIMVLTVGFPLDIGVTALAVLGLGDPAAAIVGRRFGRVPVGPSRTLEGSLAFVVAGGLAAFAVTAWLFPAPWATLALRAFVGGVAGAVAEVATRRLDDNLTIPLAVAFVLGLLRLGGL